MAETVPHGCGGAMRGQAQPSGTQGPPQHLPAWVGVSSWGVPAACPLRPGHRWEASGKPQGWRRAGKGILWQGGKTQGFAKSGLPGREMSPGAAPGGTGVKGVVAATRLCQPFHRARALQQTKRGKSRFSSITSPVKPRRDSSRPRF